MSLLLLFHGAAAAAEAPRAQQSPFQSVVRRAGLTAAVLATLSPVLVERFVPAVGTPRELAYDLPWQNPQVLAARRSVALLGSIVWPPLQRAAVGPPTDFDFFQRWQAPHIYRRKPYVELLGDTAIWASQPPPAVVVTYQEGWRSRWTDPPALLKPKPRLEGQVSWPGYGYSFVAVQTPTDLWFQPWQNPVSLSPRRAVNLQENWDWPGAGYTFFQPVSTPTEWWFERWQNPPQLLKPKRSVKLLGSDFIQGPRRPDVEYVNGWFAQWEDPPAYNVDFEFIPLFDENGDAILDENGVPILIEPFAYQIPRRCIALRVGWTWLPRIADRQFQDGWRSSFSVPRQFSAARRATNLNESWPWPGYGYFFQGIVPPPSDWWHERWQNPPQLLSARRSVGLLGYAVTTRIPETEFQEGWRSPYGNPPALTAARRATNLLESWPWPGYGYSFAAIAVTPTDWWFERWPAPPKSALRANDLLGDTTTWSARIPETEFQEGWRSSFTIPARLYQPPRQQGFTTFPGVAGIQVVVTYQEGWRSAFSQPLKTWQPPRQQGFVSFAGVSGLPITLVGGPWSAVPAGRFLGIRTRIVTAWPWQALQFTPPTATPSEWWRTQWTDPPKRKERSVYLRQSGWAAWDPQFIIQITPPTALEGVTFTFGLKRGASATPGTKEGATMTGQRKTGGATLITRVKPRVS